MSIVSERYGLCHRIREVSPTLSALGDLPALSNPPPGPYREPTDADHVPGYRRPRRAEAGAVGQLQPRVKCIYRKTVNVLFFVARARRVVASGPGTILCLPGAGRQPVLRDVRRIRADVEHDPVNIRSNRSLAVVDDDGERPGLLGERP